MSNNGPSHNAPADDASEDPTDAFVELGLIRLSETTPRSVLQTIADLAKRTIPGTREVSVTLLRDGRGHTTASSGDLALRLDEMQYRQGTGPCLDASRTGRTFSLPEIARETRWPRWAAHARENGIGSSLSIGLPIEEAAAGALNVYAAEAQSFDDAAIAVAQKFAEYAAVALANATLYDTTATLAQQMQAAMESRSVIEQAKGIIMADRRCTADEAFALLSQLSQGSNRKVREIAELVVEAAAKPRP